MANRERRRQKQLARKKKKRARRKEESISPERDHLNTRLLAEARQAPLLECLRTSTLFEEGMGTVLLSRKLARGRVAFSSVLLDVFCLGAKDTMATIRSQEEYREFKEGMGAMGGWKVIESSCALKLIKDCVDWASLQGFKPPSSLQSALVLYDQVSPGECEEEFTFGRDGVPCFIPGPFDTPAKIRKILKVLQEKHGPDGYHFILPQGGEEDYLPR